MLINIDHMSVKTAGRVLDLAAERGYPGFVVDHSWSDPVMLRRMHELGGFVGAFAYPADATPNFEEGFLDHLRRNSTALTDIAETGRLEESTENALRAAIDEYRSGFLQADGRPLGADTPEEEEVIDSQEQIVRSKRG